MSRRQALEAFSRPRKLSHQHRQWLAVLMRWLLVILCVLVWAHLTHWMDGSA